MFSFPNTAINGPNNVFLELLREDVDALKTLIHINSKNLKTVSVISRESRLIYFLGKDFLSLCLLHMRYLVLLTACWIEVLLTEKLRTSMIGSERNIRSMDTTSDT